MEKSFIVFRAADVKDLQIIGDATETPPVALDDPAVVAVS